MEQAIEELKREFSRDYEQSVSTEEVENLRIKYLGRKSRLNELFSKLPSLSDREQKSYWGKTLNQIKKHFSSLIEEKLKNIKTKDEKIDLTLTCPFIERGSRHIIPLVIEEICSIFEKMGFTIEEGWEIEDEWHNFSALNIPLEHPSRDVFDTFYLQVKEHKKYGRYLLRSHTSPSQIRIMGRKKPPLAVVSPGRVYRPDEVDATHSFMFHQIEGFAVGEGINFSHLKGVLLKFARDYFSPSVSLRFRPHFFPFTEPSAEVDISCFICGAKKDKDKKKCSVCKGKGWLEILGCGMIHPQVLKNCQISNHRYQGFAFGMGVERIIMLKYQLPDIRLFYENDLRFLKQFYR